MKPPESMRTQTYVSEGALTANADPAATTGMDAEPRAKAGRLFDELPGYELLEELGRGAMGVVYKARQIALNRLVAIKVLAADRVQSRDLIRFLAEAEAIAAIEHPHVVQVFEFGERTGRPFMALEYCSGGTLAQRLQAGPLPSHDAAGVLAKIASGVAAGHKLGIVHRDLKPGNILLFPSSDPHARDLLTPKVTDFGLAKQIHGHDLTTTQAVMGTPAYMAPEQARGDSKFVGPEADVWALGAILYECLTGKPPFRGSDTWSLLNRIQSDDPTSLRSHNRAIPRDLELICLKCLSKDAADRYPTAGEMAADLGRMLNGESVSVRAAGVVERTAKWAKRKPTLASAYVLAAAVVVLVALGTGAALLWQSAVGARDQLAIEKRTADEARRDAELARDGERAANDNLAATHYAGTVALAYRQWAANRLALAGAILDECRPDLRGWEWDYLHGRTRREAFALRGHEGAVYSVAFSTDGTTLASAGQDGTIRLWNSTTGETVAVLRGASGGIYSVSFDPIRPRLAAGGEDGSVRVWDLPNRQPLFEHKGEGDVTSIAYSPDGKSLAIGRANKTAAILAADNGDSVGTLLGHAEAITSVAFSPDSTLLATASYDKTVHLWDVASCEPRVILVHKSPVLFATFDPSFKIEPVVPARQARPRERQTISLVRANFQNDERPRPTPFRLATGLQDGSVRQWDNGSGVLATAGFAQDRNVQVGTTLSGDPIFNVQASDAAAVSEVAFRPDGKWLAAGRADGSTTFYRTDGSGATFQMSDHTGRVASIGFAKDGDRLATAGEDGLVKIWDKGPCATIYSPIATASQAGQAFLSSVGFTDDSRKLRSGRRDRSGQEWEIILKPPEASSSRMPEEMPKEPSAAPSRIEKPTARPEVAPAPRRVPRGEKKVGLFREEDRAETPRQHDLFRAVFYQPPQPAQPPPPVEPPSPPTSGASSGWTTPYTTGGVPSAGSSTSANVAGVAASSIHINDRAAPYAFGPGGWWITTDTAANLVQLGWPGGPTERDASLEFEWPSMAGRTIEERPAAASNFSLRGAKSGSPTAITAVAIAPTRDFIAAGRGDGWVVLWNSADWQVRRLFRAHASTVGALAISPDGKVLATAGFDHSIRVWNAETGAEIAAMKGHVAEVLTVAFGSDGTWLVSGAADNTARVWDARTGVERRVLRGHIGVVTAVAVSPDGKRVLTGSFDHTARLWNPATGHEVLVLPTGNAGPIRAVAFSPNGDRIAVAGFLPSVRVYDRTPPVLPLFPPDPPAVMPKPKVESSKPAK